MFASRRRAFTLIEMLIVIAIIAALVALTASASVRLIESQQIANTQMVLDRAQSVLTKNWSAVKDQALKETIENNAADPLHDTYGWIYNNFCKGINDANASGRVRVIYVKLKMRQAFPMNFTEALYPPFGNVDHLGSPMPGPCPCLQLQPLAGYKTYLNSHGISLSSGLSWESSACLLMALQRGVGGTSMEPETLTAGGAGGVDDQGYGVPVLNDVWQRPIYFSRVPAGCPTMNPNLGVQTLTTVLANGGICYAHLGNVDPLDPQGYLQAGGWQQSGYGQLFQSDTLQLMAPPGCSYRSGPMVASGGPGKDRQPGFDPITFAPLPGGSPMYAQ